MDSTPKEDESHSKHLGHDDKFLRVSELICADIYMWPKKSTQTRKKCEV